jgi:DNA polymerase-1
MLDKGELLKIGTPFALCVAAWRNLEHSISAFDEGIKKYVRNGLIHCSYNQIGAKTGRASCSEPNLQQIPKTIPKYDPKFVPDYAISAIRKAFELRKAFRAPDGWKIVSIDESQFELRLLCHYSQDKAMAQAFDEEKDIHTFTASLIFGVSYDDLVKRIEDGDPIAKDWRNTAKHANFTIVYGGGISILLETLLEFGVITTYNEVKQVRYKYLQVFPGVSSFIESVQSTIRRRGYIFNHYGRHKRIQADKAYTGVNHLIQGVTADMLKDAVVRCDNHLKQDQLKAWLGLMVHDESLFIIPHNELYIIPRLKSEMEDFPWVRCPIKAEASVGQSWGELECWNA